MTYQLPPIVGRYGAMVLREDSGHYAMEFIGKKAKEIIFWEKKQEQPKENLEHIVKGYN